MALTGRRVVVGVGGGIAAYKVCEVVRLLVKAGADVHVPFGGIKGSGWGPHEQGRAALEFYTEAVTVYQDAPLD